MQKPNVFQTLLPVWDDSVPSNEKDKTRQLYRYCGAERVKDKAGWIQDFVMGQQGKRLPLRSIMVPEAYWVPLGMLNWVITVQQDLIVRLEEPIENVPVEPLDAMRDHTRNLLWWYIRCRDKIGADAKGIEAEQELPAFHEFIFRLYQSATSRKITQAKELREFQTAQKVTLSVLCHPESGLIGESHKLKSGH